MKVCIKNNNSISLEQSKVIQDFIKMIQQEVSLNKDVNINFVPERNVKMTTGVRFPKGNIFILSGNRLLIDILRTLSHEWIHEYQYQKLGLKDNQKIQDIGGPEENMANILSGIFIKKFEKQFPNHSKLLYGEDN
jgi:hypothetical protein